MRFMEEKDAHAFLQAVMELVEAYGEVSHQRLCRFSNGNQTQDDAEEQDESDYQDICVLVALLRNLAQAEDDFMEAPQAATMAFQVALIGVRIIAPHLSDSIVSFPNIAKDYFLLLEHLTRFHPEAIDALDNDQRNIILSSLLFAITTQEGAGVVLVRSAVQSVGFLASFYYQNQSKASIGSELFQFLQTLFQVLLFNAWSTSLLDPIADTIMPLILCAESNYDSLVSEIIQSLLENVHVGAHDELSQRLDQSFQELVHTNDIQQNLSRPNQIRFRQNMAKFVQQIRGLLQTK